MYPPYYFEHMGQRSVMCVLAAPQGANGREEAVHGPRDQATIIPLSRLRGKSR